MELFIGSNVQKSPRTGGRTRRVLVVDDNIPSAEVLAEILRFWGHDTRLAHDGVAALDSAREYRPDVVLLDITLPGMDGYDVSRALRRDPGFQDTTLLAITGHGRDEDRRAAIEAGFDRHLLKPLELDDLERLLAGLAGSFDPSPC